MAIAMGLAVLISKFNFEILHPLSRKVELDVLKFIMMPEGGIHMRLSRRIFKT